MSRVRFHSYRQETVALPAWESASLIVQCFDLAFSRLWPERGILGDFFRPYINDREDGYRQAFLGAGLMGDMRTIGGRSFSLQTVALNTALASEKHRIAARIAGQHEMHSFVEAPNRRWFAEQIEGGLESGSLRKTVQNAKGEMLPCGWEEALDFLAANDRNPVVLSGSVTDDPGSVSPRSRFMEKLRARSQTDHLEMEPLSWSDFRFGDGLDSDDVLRAAREG